MLDLKAHRSARLPLSHPPILTLIVDTEEEFDWSQPYSREANAVTSVAAQPLAHARVLDRHGVKPTYVIGYPVAASAEAVAVLKGLQASGQAEIGAHLHPWVCPPFAEELNTFNSYHGNLPRALEAAKLQQLTEAIEAAFGSAPTTFKCGRYGAGPHTSELLQALGYRVDASVVPFTALTDDGGPDFTAHDAHPFWFGAPQARMLELPATAGYAGFFHRQGLRLHSRLQAPRCRLLRVPELASKLGMFERIRLTPEGYTLGELKGLTRRMFESGHRYFGLTYHSPSLLPGHTPYVRDARQREEFFKRLDGYLHFFRHTMGGQLLSVSQALALYRCLAPDQAAEAPAP